MVKRLKIYMGTYHLERESLQDALLFAIDRFELKHSKGGKFAKIQKVTIDFEGSTIHITVVG